jgi:small subunit ribosomal protein S1
LNENVAVKWLDKEYDYQQPRRGQIRQGLILKLGERGAVVDVGLKRDGLVPPSDIERLRDDTASQLEPGREVATCIVRPWDREGNLILSFYRARLEKDWKKAEEFLESGDIWRGKVTGHNRGGLLVRFGGVRGFVPASHLWELRGRRLSADQRRAKLKAHVGQELPLKVIEVNRDRRRLILSERLARRKLRKQNLKRLLDELLEGQIVQGTVSRIVDFGAFMDLGGADGLIHISELAWQRVRHPSEVLQVGDEIEAYVLRLDHKRKRISLSLKRLQPSPWGLVDKTYSVGQLVSGTVSNVVDFGAFVSLDIGVDGLVHVSELADPRPSDPREVVQRGDELVLRILRIDSLRHRIALSLKRVSNQERGEWLAQRAGEQNPEADEANSSVSEDEEEAQPVSVHIAGTASLPLSGQAEEKGSLQLLSPAFAGLSGKESGKV